MATIQIHHVPEGLHRRLKARADLEGLSLSRWLTGMTKIAAAFTCRMHRST